MRLIYLGASFFMGFLLLDLDFIDIMWLQSLQSSFNLLIVRVIYRFCSCKVPGMVVGNIKIISMLVTLQLCKLNLRSEAAPR